ncbi:hypothetical protein F442_15318 [Phytophthora nicotianae P10297]|uniref:Uncharacterized protein n=1 Tax=Phytophthora nicotianae P10297 TaxID=1317064 RepID=W2YRL3_PHYNI|nr:hypothetical protein F442_15318 [Phytophthora nicotianae P10297]
MREFLKTGTEGTGSSTIGPWSLFSRGRSLRTLCMR